MCGLPYATETAGLNTSGSPGVGDTKGVVLTVLVCRAAVSDGVCVARFVLVGVALVVESPVKVDDSIASVSRVPLSDAVVQPAKIAQRLDMKIRRECFVI